MHYHVSLPHCGMCGGVLTTINMLQHKLQDQMHEANDTAPKMRQRQFPVYGELVRRGHHTLMQSCTGSRHAPQAMLDKDVPNSLLSNMAVVKASSTGFEAGDTWCNAQHVEFTN